MLANPRGPWLAPTQLFVSKSDIGTKIIFSERHEIYQTESEIPILGCLMTHSLCTEVTLLLLLFEFLGISLYLSILRMDLQSSTEDQQNILSRTMLALLEKGLITFHKILPSKRS